MMIVFGSWPAVRVIVCLERRQSLSYPLETRFHLLEIEVESSWGRQTVSTICLDRSGKRRRFSRNLGVARSSLCDDESLREHVWHVLWQHCSFRPNAQRDSIKGYENRKCAVDRVRISRVALVNSRSGQSAPTGDTALSPPEFIAKSTTTA
jgi:hypothetical protein